MGGYKSIKTASGEWHKKKGKMRVAEENVPGWMTGMVAREAADEETKEREKGGEGGRKHCDGEEVGEYVCAYVGLTEPI